MGKFSVILRMFGRRSYICFDRYYTLYNIITFFLILMISCIIYIFQYKTIIIDPIQNIKEMFINISLINLIILAACNLLNTKYSKNTKHLLQNFIIIFLFLLGSLISFFFYKFYINAIYTEEKIQIFFDNSDYAELFNIDKEYVIKNIRNPKIYYVSEFKNLYNIFNIKLFGILICYTLFSIFNLYEIHKSYKKNKIMKRIEKDDIVLFDKEENIKI